jgi:hypothetical protein
MLVKFTNGKELDLVTWGDGRQVAKCDGLCDNHDSPAQARDNIEPSKLPFKSALRGIGGDGER